MDDIKNCQIIVLKKWLNEYIIFILMLNTTRYMTKRSPLKIKTVINQDSLPALHYVKFSNVGSQIVLNLNLMRL